MAALLRSSWDADGRMKYAGQRAMQTYRSQSWENAVGGTRTTMRAIYGSSDRALLDHRNDTMCHLAPEDLTTTNEPRRIDREFVSTWDNVSTYTPPTVEQVQFWARRAERKGMTVLQYARDVLGLALP